MTLKKCTVTQLDDTFWRVDWEGAATVDKDARRITHSSPRIAEHHDGEWFFCGYWYKSLADALALWGLTAEQPKPDTAEGRVRAAVADPEGLQNVTLFKGDLRAILAELDRLREELEAAGARWHMLSDERDMLAAKLSEQHLVDVDAVLIPIDRVVGKLRKSAKEYQSARLLEMDCGDRKEEAWHSARAVSYEAAARRVEAAIAEAEKIGVGE